MLHRIGPVCVAALLTISTPVMADEPSFWSLFAPQATTTGWEATIEPANANVVLASTSWGAVIHKDVAGRLIETGSISDTSKSAPGPRVTGAPHAMSGIASYYWQDQMTASGEVFDKTAMTAAHKTLPLGSNVKVTNLQNGRSTVVRINDRGPYIGGRVIDLSQAAAEVLGFTAQGLAPVQVDLMGPQTVQGQPALALSN